MIMILGTMAAVGAGALWLAARSPLGRAVGCSVAGFAEAARSEPGALH